MEGTLCFVSVCSKSSIDLGLGVGDKKVFSPVLVKNTVPYSYRVVSCLLRVGQGSDNAHYDAVSTDQRKADIRQTFINSVWYHEFTDSYKHTSQASYIDLQSYRPPYHFSIDCSR